MNEKLRLLCLTAVASLGLGLSASGLGAQTPQDPPAKPWSDEQLEQNIQGFLAQNTRELLMQVRKLLVDQDVAFLSICNKIHGNHAEYLLRIEKLLDQLDDDRWDVRERAEKRLIEIGARARDLILKQSKVAKTIEEQIRARRAVAEIEKKGTEDEKRQIHYIRGLVVTALYMKSKDRLTKALVSSLRHPDPLIVEGAIRALGAHGKAEHATILDGHLKASGGTHRIVTLAALARMRGTKALETSASLLNDSKLSDAHAMLIFRILRERDDSGDLMDKLKTHDKRLLRQSAKLEMPAGDEAAPLRARISMSDLSLVEGRFFGFKADGIRVVDPALVEPGEEEGKEQIDKIGLPELLLSLNESDRIMFPDARLAEPKGDFCRLFLLQGSMITGQFVSATKDSVTIESKYFGKLSVPRKDVQGLTIDPKLDRLLGASNKHDKIRLNDKKSLTGKIVSMDRASVSMLGADNKLTRLPIDKVAGVLFQRPRTQAFDTRTYTRLYLITGDKILCHIVASSKSHVGIVTDSLGAFVVPLKEVLKMEFGVGGGAMWGFTLVADYSDNRIAEYDDQGREVFAIEEVFGVWDVECLENGNLLLTEFSVNRVSEMTRDKKIVWTFEELKNPYDADRLPNGNTLIADTYGRRVIEVKKVPSKDKDGKDIIKSEIVWKYDKNVQPYDVDRLPNGNTLIVDGSDDRIIEVDPKGKIVWELKNIVNCHDADRLPNGNTLITIRMSNIVQEVNPSGKVVMEIKDLSSPSDADRLPNGNTIVAENGMVREFDRHGNEISRMEITWAVEVNRY